MPVVAVGVAAAAASAAAGVAIAGLTVTATAIAVGVATAAATHLLQESLTPDLGAYATDPTTDQALTTEGNQPRKIVYGEAVVGGQIVGYAKPTIDGDDYHVMVLHLVGHPCESVSLYEIEGKTQAELGSALQINVHTGDQTTVDSLANTYVHGWTNDHIGINQTYVVLRIRVDPDLIPNGVNECKFKVKGKRVYDPRKDDTVGGSGLHRVDDATTWEWSDNPALCAYDYLRFHGSRTVPQRRIPWDFVATSANYCAEAVSYTNAAGNAATGQRFGCNGVLNNTIRPGEGLKHIMATMGAKPYRVGGKIYIKPAMYAGPATTTITVNDTNEMPAYRPHRPLREQVNTVRCEYIAPSKKWQITSAPVISNPDYVARDRSVLESVVRLNLVTRDHQAQRLGMLKLERSRAGFVTSYTLPGLRLDIVPGNDIRFVDPSSGIDKEFLVEEAKFNAAKNQTELSLVEDDQAIYPDSFEPAEGDLTPNSNLPDTTSIQAPENLQWATTPNDSWRQGVLTWDHPSPSSVINYIVSVSNADGETPDTQLTFTPANNEQSLAHLPLGLYTVAVSARNRFKTGPGVGRNIHIAVPSTPTQGVVVNVLPGRVIINGPTLAHRNAIYEWRYSFDGDSQSDFDNALNLGTSDSITITNTPHDGVVYVWYRLIDGDLPDPNWQKFSVAELIGISFEDVDPEALARVSIPSLPSNLGTTLVRLTTDIQEQNAVNADLIEFKNGFHALLIQQASEAALQKFEVMQLSRMVGSKSVSLQFEEYTALQFGYTNDDGEFVDGALGEHLERIKFETSLGESVSVYEYFQVIEDSLGDVSGRIHFAIDINGRLTGMFIEGSETQSEINIVSNIFNLVDQEGNILLGVNAATGELEFYGSGSFKGKLASPTFEMVGDGFMKVDRALPFGPDNLRMWKGPVMLANGEPDYSNLTKLNAVAWEDVNGNEYKGGNLTLQGVLDSSAMKTGSGVMLSDAGLTGPMMVMSLSNSRSMSRSDRTLYSNTFIGPAYEVSPGVTHDDFRLVNYRTSLWLRILITKHAENNQQVNILLEVRYQMEDTVGHAAIHNQWETIYSETVDSSYDYALMYLPHVYTTRDEPWEQLELRLSVSSSSSGGKPLSASLEIQAFNNAPSGRDAHTLTGNTYDAPTNYQPPSDGIYRPPQYNIP